MSEAQLSEEEFLDSLPDDPIDAFPKYEKWIKATCMEENYNSGDMYLNYNRYFSEILVYCQEYGIDIGYNIKNI